MGEEESLQVELACILSWNSKGARTFAWLEIGVKMFFPVGRAVRGIEREEVSLWHSDQGSGRLFISVLMYEKLPVL